MKQETRDALHALNLRFYRAHADAFSDTRERPWPGTERALEHLALDGTAPAPSVLDVGCGNGRLLTLLARRHTRGFAYTGVDASERLLALARERFGAFAPELVQADLVGQDPAHVLPDARYDLVALLGVLHHVPSEAARTHLLSAAAARVAHGGVLVLTAWRFDRDPRAMRRRVPEEAYARLEPALRDACHDLGPGDHLLYFGAGRGAVRYCHAASDAEIERWLRALHGLDLVTIDRFCADGSGERMNEYVVLHRPHAG